MIENFHLLRPEWLLALIPLFIISGLLLRKQLFSRNWQSVIDPQLLPHLLIGKPGKQSHLPVITFTLMGLLCILSLSGPAWQQLPQPVFKQQSALVIALDLSQSMDATDIKPSRLTRARYKVSDILKQRKEGQTALIAYAGSAFTVTPLTDDTDTIDALVPSLTTDIMPAQGSNTSRALKKAEQLLSNAGISKGDIFLITDNIEASAADMMDELRSKGHRISVLAIGTEAGAPVALTDGDFLKDQSGAIVIPKLNIPALRKFTSLSGGRFSLITTDDRDTRYLLGQLDNDHFKTSASDTEMKADVWREEGPWLLLLLIPLAALAFRRGYLVIILALILPYPDTASALSWDEIWLNDNQRAQQQFEQGHHQQATELFNNPEWKAAAHYRAGDYQQAIEQLSGLDNAEAHYNRGNALARMGNTAKAIEAYKQALKLDPDHEDAKHNKSLLEQQQQQTQQQNKQQDSDSQNKDESQNSSDASKNDKNNDKQSSSDNNQSSNNDSQTGQQDNKQPPSENSQQQAKKNQQDNQNQKPADQSDAEQTDAKPPLSDSASEQQELSEQASKQWLRKIPDNPGDLLKRKFKYQYNQQQTPERTSNPW